MCGEYPQHLWNSLHSSVSHSICGAHPPPEGGDNHQHGEVSQSLLNAVTRDMPTHIGEHCSQILPSGLKRKLGTSPTKTALDAASTTTASTSICAPTREGTVWIWNNKQSSIDEVEVAKACKCKPHEYCWIMASVMRLPTNPAVLCPFIGGKGPGGIDHTDMSSEVHVATLKKREDETWWNKVASCVNRRPQTPAEQQRGKKVRSNYAGEGPPPKNAMSLVELYAGIVAFSFALRCMQVDSQLLAFTELPGHAATYVEAAYNAPNAGPTEMA